MKALLLEEKDGKVAARIASVEESALPPGEVTVAVRYSTLNYKDGMILERRRPSRPDLSARARRRFRRHGRGFERAAVAAGRRGDPDRLARRRNALGRLCREGAGRCRPARAAARRHERQARDGDRHGGLHRHARRHGARAARAQSRRGRGAGDGRGGRARQRRRGASLAARPSRRRLDRAARDARLSAQARRRVLPRPGGAGEEARTPARARALGRRDRRGRRHDARRTC